MSPGCINCYAERSAGKNAGLLGEWGPTTNGGTRILAAPGQWRGLSGWHHAAGALAEDGVESWWPIFCASFADVFEDTDEYQLTNHLGQKLWTVPMEYQQWLEPTLPFFWPAGAESMQVPRLPPHILPVTTQRVREWLFRIMERTPNLTWQLLTKRIENVETMVPRHWLGAGQGSQSGLWPQNVWLGATVCDKPEAKRIPAELCGIMANIPVRWLSLEPLLDDVADELRPWITSEPGGIGWAVVGGESGAKGGSKGKARPFDITWADRIMHVCRRAGVPFFMKQVGDDPRSGGEPMAGIETDAGSAPGEWPAWLRRREVPPVLITPTRDNHRALFRKTA